MLFEAHIGDVWSLFAGYIDEKVIGAAAEHYVELLVDRGIDDQTLKTTLGIDRHLDRAIRYYLEDSAEDCEDEDADELAF